MIDVAPQRLNGTWDSSGGEFLDAAPHFPKSGSMCRLAPWQRKEFRKSLVVLEIIRDSTIEAEGWAAEGRLGQYTRDYLGVKM